MRNKIFEIIKKYNPEEITIGVLGGHSALDVCHGAKLIGFNTLAVCQKGRDKTYSKYYKTTEEGGCIDEVILVDKFEDVVKPEVQEQLRKKNTIFIHNRYFWVYFSDYSKVENDFMVPIYGNRQLVRLEERDQPNNQYILLEKAGIKIPKIIRPGNSKMNEKQLKKALDDHFVGNNGGPLLIKVNEAIRGYERAFFVITNEKEFFDTSKEMMDKKLITQKDLDNAVIEEFVIGAQVNFNFFYSPISGQLELMGTDTRRQTSLDGFLRLDATVQTKLIEGGYKPKMIETGHIACTVKESIVEKAFEAGEKFLSTLSKEVPPGMIGPFALQGAISADHGKEEIVIFDVSMRIPGSPGTAFTPYSMYKYGHSLSYGERIAMDIHAAVYSDRLNDIVT